MQTRFIVPVLGAALIVGVGVLVFSTKKPPVIIEPVAVVEAPAVAAPAPVAPVTPQKVVPKAPPAVAPVPQGMTLAVVAKHNSRSSCWSVVNGAVYDLTSWIPNHPGGEGTILSMCGKDGSALYGGQHSTRSKPARILGGFKLGALVQ